MVETEKITIDINTINYQMLIKQYHFDAENVDILTRIGKQVYGSSVPILWYGFLHKSDVMRENTSPDDILLCAIVTLGKGVDDLQAQYNDREQLSSSYMVECISMELLRAAYEQIGEIIYRKHGHWLADMSFLGEKYPLTLMDHLFPLLNPTDVSYNKAYMLLPKKTVVFISELQETRNGSICRTCDSCSNLTCANRLKRESAVNLTYGYQRIFEKGHAIQKDIQ